MPLDQGSLIFYFERGRDGALRLAELGKDEFNFRRGERAAAQVAEMRESRIETGSGDGSLTHFCVYR